MEERYCDCKDILNKRIAEKRTGEAVEGCPKVSVVIPAYNIGDLIAETIESVFAQTFKEFEVILVNDGSDDTPLLEKQIAPFANRITYIRQENTGAAFARNTAICLSKGELIAFLDADDIWLPNYLHEQVAFLESGPFDMVYADAELFGIPSVEGKTFMQTSRSEGKVTPESLISADCNILNSSTLLRKDCLISHGMFDSSLERMQDFDVWFRLAKNSVRISYQRKVLSRYRIRPGSLSGDNIQRAERTIEVYHAIREKYDLNEGELETLNRRLAVCEAQLVLEKGKSLLVQKKFSAAKSYFQEANKVYRNPKIAAVSVLLDIAPEVVLKAYKKIRPDEVKFVATEFSS